MVNTFLPRLGALLVVLTMMACAPVTAPPPYPGHPYPSPPDRPTGGSPEPAPQPPVRTIEPVEPARSSAETAVQQLLAEGWQLRSKGAYERANAVAERALRLERSNPEIYLLMSSNYYSMWQLALAEQVARQGLPLASDDRSLKTRLQVLLNEILASK